jgi:hypothetical protein
VANEADAWPEGKRTLPGTRFTLIRTCTRHHLQPSGEDGVHDLRADEHDRQVRCILVPARARDEIRRRRHAELHAGEAKVVTDDVRGAVLSCGERAQDVIIGGMAGGSEKASRAQPQQ